MAKNKTGDYTIIDWFIKDGNLPYQGTLSVWTKEEKVTEAIQSIKDKRVQSFIRNADYFDVASTATGATLRAKIDKENEDWKDTSFSTIENAKDIDDIGTFRMNDFEPVKDEYRSEVVEQIETKLDEKEAELNTEATLEQREETDKAFDKLKRQLESAKTLDEIRRVDINTLPPEAIEERNALINLSTQRQLEENETLQESFDKKFNRASSLSEFKRLVGDEATLEQERRLRDKIRELESE